MMPKRRPEKLARRSKISLRRLKRQKREKKVFNFLLSVIINYNCLTCTMLCIIVEAAAGSSKENDDGFVAKLITQIIKNIQVWCVIVLHNGKLICCHCDM